MALSNEQRDALYKVYTVAYECQNIHRTSELTKIEPLLTAEAAAQDLNVPAILLAQATSSGFRDVRDGKPMADIETFQSGRER
ncbi:MAG: hypothetical protein ACKVOE_03845 [Rickettsiales bacterium]